jgi:hypothetical protein
MILAQEHINDIKKTIRMSLPSDTRATWWSVSYDAKKQIMIAIENTHSWWKTKLTYNISHLVTKTQQATNSIIPSSLWVQPNEDFGLWYTGRPEVCSIS